MQLFPKNTDFFKYFESMADQVIKSSSLLIKIENNAKSGTKIHSQIRKIETEADEICHKIIDEVNQNFITSIDREDIYKLSGNLDNIVDYIENLAASFIVYKMTNKLNLFDQYLKYINKSGIKMAELVYLLKFKDKKIAKAKKLMVEINKLENEVDDLIRRDLIALFANPKKNPLTVIKLKDIYTSIEEVMDEYEKTALTIEEIIVKNF